MPPQGRGFAAPLRRSTCCGAVAYRSSLSRPADPITAGLTGLTNPVKIQAFWLGAKRGASGPSLISRVAANRSKVGARRKRRVLSGKPSDGESMSPSTAPMMPSPF